MNHAAIRHTESGALGTCPESAMEQMRARGWVRVSDYVPNPVLLHLPDFADAPDLDADPAPATPEPDAAPRRATAPTTTPTKDEE